MNKVFVNTYGINHPIQTMYANVNGYWASIKKAWIKQNNTWIQTYECAPWRPLGQTIKGQAAEDESGRSVSLNAAGDRLAIGARHNVGDTGHTRIFQWNSSTSTWTQMGLDIKEDLAADNIGSFVSLNAAGDRVAIGVPYKEVNTYKIGHTRIFQWNSSTRTWTQMGSNIVGEVTNDFSGRSVSLNAAGDRVAIGAPGSDAYFGLFGHTRIYEWNSGTSTWTKMGSNINGEAAGDLCGYSVSLNAAGDRVAIGAPFNDGNGSNSGHARIYQWNSGTSTWTKMGSNINGEGSEDQSGISVSLNAVGDRVAIGAINHNGKPGYTKVYQWNSGTNTWTQMGSNINGEAGYDRFGFSVSLNAAGDRVAIGAALNDGNGDSSGHVRVYQWNGGDWYQISLDIDGISGDWLGYSVSLNAAGDRVAAGAPYSNENGYDSGHARVYTITNWIQMGSDIDGEGNSGKSGSSVSVNAAGDRVAIGAPLNNTNSGRTRVYQWNSGTSTWTQMGLDIGGIIAQESSGQSVSLNAAGDRVAIGAPWGNGNGTFSGRTRIYQWNSSTWTQMGSDINGEASEDEFGSSVSLNAAGDRVAIGAPRNDGNGSNSGHTRIYEWKSGNWTKMGSLDIDGEAEGDLSGISVSLNAAGDIVAIGASYNDGIGMNSGHVKVYQWNSGTSTWTQIGLDIDAEGWDRFGSSVSLNAAGNRVAIGAPYNGGIGPWCGHARVYQWNSSTSTWTKMGSDIDGEAAFDYSGSSVSLNAAGDRVAIGAKENDGNGNSSGHVRVYQWNGGDWYRVNLDIDGKYVYDVSGASVSLNAVGDRVAIGAPGNNYNEGQTRVFSLISHTPLEFVPAQNVTYTVTAQDPAATFQWTLNGTNVSGATQKTFTTTSAEGIGCKVTSILPGGMFIGPVMQIVSVNKTPTIHASYAPSYYPGTTVTFSVGLASGANPLTYQWYKDNVAIPGATSLSLSVASTIANKGIYKCVVSNLFGSASTTNHTF